MGEGTDRFGVRHARFAKTAIGLDYKLDAVATWSLMDNNLSSRRRLLTSDCKVSLFGLAIHSHFNVQPPSGGQLQKIWIKPPLS